MYWDRYIHHNPRRIEPLDKPLDMYVMLDTETTGLHPEEGATLIEIGAFLVQPGNENSRLLYWFSLAFPPLLVGVSALCTALSEHPHFCIVLL